MHNWNKTSARISEVKFLAIKLLFNVSFLLFGLGIQTSAGIAEETKKKMHFQSVNQVPCR